MPKRGEPLRKLGFLTIGLFDENLLTSSVVRAEELYAHAAFREIDEVVRDYPHRPEKVWRAVTDPSLVPLWTATGQGARPVGFSPTVGNRFQFVARPQPGWRGVVDCEVLDVSAPSLLRYSWIGGEGEDPTSTLRPKPLA